MLTIFQNYVKVQDKIRNRLTIERNEPFLNAFIKNAEKLFLILFTISLIGLAIFAVVQNFLVIGSLLAVGVGAILYGIEGKAYYDELILTIGIPIALLNGFVAFIKFLLYVKPQQTESLLAVITACVFFLFGVLIIMTGCSSKNTEILNNEKT